MAKVRKSDAERRAQLGERQYQVARQKGTEPAFTDADWNCHDDGIYRCISCDAVLFASEDKFDSGCRWPSFSAPRDPATIETAEDRSHGMRRSEVICHGCGAHLGQVFPDGPGPTGLRYCINSISLKLERT